MNLTENEGAIKVCRCFDVVLMSSAKANDI